jgi:aerobic carbon-monoxide dehydrogenase large subunit
MLEAAEEDLEIVDGEVRVVGAPQLAVKLGELARVLKGAPGYGFPEDIEPGLEASATFRIDKLAYTNACHAVEVEVDIETGGVRILRYIAMQDAGRRVNPMIVEGQVHGGIAQGIGQALLEVAVYDKDGQLVTGSLMDYSMPHAHDLPSFKVGLTETKSPSNPLGIKGCGEAGAIASPAAVINAITDAIGTEELAMPATAQAVWSALTRAQPRQVA